MTALSIPRTLQDFWDKILDAHQQCLHKHFPFGGDIGLYCQKKKGHKDKHKDVNGREWE